MPGVFSAKPVRVVRGGQTYNGSFRQVGGRVHVDSAYGSNAEGVPVGKKDPKIIAERLLGEFVAKFGHRAVRPDAEGS